nr:AlNc14C344G10839 [Albugo laibachii Nc14]|eukprot:CCA26074.1 AlNc14C344G10839 [Albugo laibachii Nc14]
MCVHVPFSPTPMSAALGLPAQTAVSSAGLALLRWLEMFANSVPNTVIVHFCSYSTDICPICLQIVVAPGERLGIVFVLLPANLTHLIQPPDIGLSSIDKRTAIQIVNDAWNQVISGRNLTAEFKIAVPFPLSYPQIRGELNCSAGVVQEEQLREQIGYQ